MKEYVIPAILVVVSIICLTVAADYLFDVFSDGVIGFGGVYIDKIHLYPS
ncbi:hypothetical protein ACTZGB_12010 [Yersinia bercovieri]|nr:hypothetical protein [Yersinia bercovieri]MCB5301716.1 hypothetical protein [Yersinia bercovieri]MDN0102955.1 hypothetical protein [Yersinia bercovieri]QKJ07530.1 hypothetical protein HRK25_11900 [Yersinia bercovieri ATCC 43970]CNI22090.1 Uncharacterised protein [Yersinia bercovieri]